MSNLQGQHAIVTGAARGIGMNVAVFSLLNSVVFKPLPIEREQDMVRVFSNAPRGCFAKALPLVASDGFSSLDIQPGFC